MSAGHFKKKDHSLVIVPFLSDDKAVFYFLIGFHYPVYLCCTDPYTAGVQGSITATVDLYTTMIIDLDVIPVMPDTGEGIKISLLVF